MAANCHKKLFCSLASAGVICTQKKSFHDEISPHAKIPLKVNANKWSLQEFVRTFMMTSTPVLITKSIDSWKARSWTPDLLKTEFPDSKFRVILDDQKEKVEFMTLKEFHERNDTNDSGRFTPYIFHPFGQNDSIQKEYETPEYFIPSDHLKQTNEHKILIGMEGSGSKLHVDPNLTSAWNALLYGQKRWILLKDLPEDIAKATENTTAKEWFTNVYPKLSSDVEFLECIQNPGEIVFVPAGWWHAVLNVGETIAIAGSFLEHQNEEILNELRRLRERQQQKQILQAFTPAFIGIIIFVLSKARARLAIPKSV